MENKLENMTLQQLWKLFPIFLTKHDDNWKDWYIEEEKKLKALIPSCYIVRISHIGSTAIDKIWSKAIVGILVEVLPDSLDEVADILKQNRYLLMSKTDKRYSFNKGYTPKGFAEKVYHIHLRKQGDNDELYFRDYLATHDSVAWEYEKLKLRLWRKYPYDRDAYTLAKSEFVSKYTNIAKQLYKERYT